VTAIQVRGPGELRGKRKHTQPVGVEGEEPGRETLFHQNVQWRGNGHCSDPIDWGLKKAGKGVAGGALRGKRVKKNRKPSRGGRNERRKDVKGADLRTTYGRKGGKRKGLALGKKKRREGSKKRHKRVGKKNLKEKSGRSSSSGRKGGIKKSFRPSSEEEKKMQSVPAEKE